MPFYALGWILTWFSHDLIDYKMITRLFDLFISSSVMMPLYLSAAVCLFDDLYSYINSILFHRLP